MQVTQILNIGALVELPGGKTALIQISDLSVELLISITSVANAGDPGNAKVIISADPRNMLLTECLIVRESTAVSVLLRAGAKDPGISAAAELQDRVDRHLGTLCGARDNRHKRREHRRPRSRHEIISAMVHRTGKNGRLKDSISVFVAKKQH
jgi:hypothetical protein